MLTRAESHRRRVLGPALILVFFTFALAIPGSSSPLAAARQPEDASWTFMVYMAADNNLEDAGIDDFLEMATAGSDDNLNIVVQFDRIPGYDGTYGNWTTTKRFRVGPGMTPDPANAIMDIGEANMGAMQTVVDFVDWARANYPADHYALVFWNHGGGWLSDLSVRPEGVVPEDFCWDDTNGGDALTSAELFQSLDLVTDGGMLPIDGVGFDACLMAMWEVDNQIKPFGTAVTASSEELEPWDGWPYNTILGDLKANPGWTPAQLGSAIVERYYQSYGNDETQSAKDLGDAYAVLNSAIDTFAQALIDYEPTYHAQYNTARNAAQDFGGDFIDVYDFAAKINVYVTQPDINAAATGVMDALTGAIIDERHGPYWPGAHGVDLYFPLGLSNWAAYQALRSSQLTHWDEFVQYHATGVLPCAKVFLAGVDYFVEGLTVSFAPAIYGDDPIDYAWSFGDGTSSTLPNPVHTYPVPGSYGVTLDVTNCSGGGTGAWSGVVEVISGIVVQPPALEASLQPGETDGQVLWITNAGTIDLNWTIHEIVPPAAKVAVPVAPQVRPRTTPVADAALAEQVRAGGRADGVIYLRELADLTPAYAIPDKAARRRFVVDRLQETAALSGAGLYAWLEAAGAAPRRLWVANAIAATLDARLLAAVTARPEVAHIAAVRAAWPVAGLAGTAQAAPDAVEWNIAKIRADQAWSELGITGQGSVVGSIDTGVEFAHPALVTPYRGNLGGGAFDHNYNWFDFVNGSPVPIDNVGHGTFGMGIVAGDDGGGNQIGVAPGARWIAVKACDYSCTDADLLAAAQWMLAPTALDGTSPDPAKAPDVVINGWGSGGGCDPWFEAALQAWLAANILPVFSPGGQGPACNTIAYPAASSNAVAAGATDSNDLIASFSGRGPSACAAGYKPEVSAPGVNVRSSEIGGGYYTGSGTSWSAAHLAGTAALVLAADPTLSVVDLMDIIEDSALCIEDLSCGGEPCPDGGNNVYGWGRIDAYEAVALALGAQDVLPWLSESPTGGTLAPGETAAVAVTFDATDLDVGVYQGLLDVESDDPNTPHVGVPVTMTVYLPCEPAHILGVTAEADGCTVAFSADVTGTAPISYTWDFGPFGTSHEAAPVVDFGETGSYTAALEVENCAGAGQDEYELTVEVECAPACEPVDVIGVTQNAEGCTVTFGADVTGTQPISLTWDFGSFGILDGPAPVVDFGETGTYTGTLDAWNCGGGGHDQVPVTVDVECVPACIPAEITSVVGEFDGCTVTFSAVVTGSEPLAFAWDFGAFGTSAERAPVIDFHVSGTYAYTLALTNCEGAGSDIHSGTIDVSCNWRIYVPLVVRTG